ncbi:unnamed protein product [Rotaria sp. Silwood2]|nr:unnamed protein product [Rotaria sp. Silwood2]
MDHITSLADLSDEQISQINDQNVNLKKTFYRGQLISACELERLRSNRGGLISMNTFMSTTERMEVALIYAGDGSRRPTLESCLFEIEIDPLINLKNLVFANIAYCSQFPEEKEFLFSLGTSFRIESVQEQNKVWHVKLTADTIKNTLAKDVCDHIFDCIAQGSAPLLALSNVVRVIGPSKEALRYLKLAEREYVMDSVELYTIYHHLVEIYIENGDHENAIKYLHKQRIELEKTAPLNYAASGLLYLNEGILFKKYGLFSQAEFSFHQALKTIALSEDANEIFLDMVYEQFGYIYLLMDDTDSALFYFKKPLDKHLRTSVLDPLYAAKWYIHIGHVFLALKDYSSTLEYFLMADEINQQALPPDYHINIYMSYIIGHMYVQNDDHEMALKYYTRYNNMQHHDSSSVKDLSLAMLNTSVAIQRCQQSEWAISMEHLEKAVAVQKVLAPFCTSTAITYKLMGDVYRNFKNDHATALLYHRKSLDILNKLDYRVVNPMLSSPIRQNVVQDYWELKEYKKVIEMFRKNDDHFLASLKTLLETATTSDNQLLFDIMFHSYSDNIYVSENNELRTTNQVEEILNASLPIDNKTLYNLYINLGNTYIDEKNYESALTSFSKALEVQRKALPFDHPSFIRTYDGIASAASKLKDYKKMLYNLEKILHIYQNAYPLNHRQIFLTYHKIFAAYVKLLEAPASLIYAEKLLDLSLKYDYPETKCIQKLVHILRADSETIVNELAMPVYPLYNEQEFECYSSEDLAMLCNSQLWHEYKTKSWGIDNDDVCYVFQADNDPFWWIKVTGIIPNATITDLHDLLGLHFVERRSEWQQLSITSKVLHRFNFNAEICYFQNRSAAVSKPSHDSCVLKYRPKWVDDNDLFVSYRTIDIPKLTSFGGARVYAPDSIQQTVL